MVRINLIDIKNHLIPSPKECFAKLKRMLVKFSLLNYLANADQEKDRII